MSKLQTIENIFQTACITSKLEIIKFNWPKRAVGDPLNRPISQEIARFTRLLGNTILTAYCEKLGITPPAVRMIPEYAHGDVGYIDQHLRGHRRLIAITAGLLQLETFDQAVEVIEAAAKKYAEGYQAGLDGKEQHCVLVNADGITEKLFVPTVTSGVPTERQKLQFATGQRTRVSQPSHPGA